MQHPTRSLEIWLIISAIMIFFMAIIGAITRLTESGLSIVEWAPITGAMPPLNDADWQKAYAAWQATPQAKLVLTGLSLEDFKVIFFWEWLHRLWGRLIGLVYALPLFYFLARGMVPAGFKTRLLVLLLLGGLQGGIGWFMVQSGLADRPTVSHYRLALHLSIALVLFGLIIWTILDLRRLSNKGSFVASFCLRRHGFTALVFLSLTIVWGAFVAGLDAGMAYNTFPLMGDHFLPPESFTLQPLWLNVLENTALVQFTHRMLAMLTAVMILTWVLRLAKQQALGIHHPVLMGLGLCIFAQIGLGVATVLLAVPAWLGALHQANALILLALTLITLHASLIRR